MTDIKVEVEVRENEPVTVYVRGNRFRDHEDGLCEERNNKENKSGSKRCIVCGMRSILQLQPNLFENWNSSCAESLNKSFGIDVSKLQNASYCQDCFRITRDIDFFIRSISSFDIRLRKSEAQLQERISMNPRTPFAQISSNSTATTAALLQRKRRMLQQLRKRESKSMDAGSDSDTSGTLQPKTRMRPSNSKSVYIVPDKTEDKIVTDNTQLDGFDDDDEYSQPISEEIELSSDEEYSPKKKKISVTADDRMKTHKNGTVAIAIRLKKNRNRASRSTGHWKFHCPKSNCTFRCVKESSFKGHMRFHNGDSTPYHCDNPGCEAKYKSEESLRKHEKKCCPSSTTGAHNKCQPGECRKSFANEDLEQEHFKKCHPELVYKRCEFCNLKFGFGTEDAEALKQHEEKHRQAEVPFACIINECDCVFTNFMDLKHHVAKTHEESSEKCDKCSSILPNRESLKNHQKKLHSEKPREELVCPEPNCEYKTTVKNYMRNHIKTHSNERPFMCDECGAAFKKQTALRRHQISHTDERRYDCKVCGKKFRLPQQLKHHEETHAPSKSYLCSGCGKPFRGSNNLRQHETFHCPELPKILSSVARKRLIKQGMVPPEDGRRRIIPYFSKIRLPQSPVHDQQREEMVDPFANLTRAQENIVSAFTLSRLADRLGHESGNHQHH